MKLVVLGGGESGVGAALLGRHLGYEVFLSDKGKLAESYRDELITHRIAFEEGQHSMDRIFAAELVVKSPGIPDTVPMVVALRERGIEVISEIEFAGRHTEAKMVCITGSNGKTTTTLLTCHILTTAGIDGRLMKLTFTWNFNHGKKSGTVTVEKKSASERSRIEGK